jgi:hypothetical protein
LRTAACCWSCAGTESSEELSHIHLDSDACLIAVERPCAAGDQPGAVGEGVALVLAFRGTEPLELSDFQSDFDAVPEAGEVCGQCSMLIVFGALCASETKLQSVACVEVAHTCAGG